MTKRIVYSLYYFECGFTSFTLVITNRTPIQIERKEKKRMAARCDGFKDWRVEI